MSSRDTYFYAVQKGHNRGVYKTYKECQMQIKGFRFPKFRKFDDYQEALKFAFPERFPFDSIIKEEDNEKNCNWIKPDHQKAQELKEIYSNIQNSIDKIQNEVVIPKGTGLEKTIDVWISGFKGNNGVIGVYFGEGDSRNFIGFHLWKGPITMTRLRLAACIKTIEILQKDAPCTAIIHTENSYLSKALVHWTREWFSRGKDIAWSKSENNHDMLEALCKISKEYNVKILPAYNKKHDENMIKISSLVSAFIM